MKKIILVICCLMIMAGCSNKKESANTGSTSTPPKLEQTETPAVKIIEEPTPTHNQAESKATSNELWL